MQQAVSSAACRRPFLLLLAPAAVDLLVAINQKHILNFDVPFVAEGWAV